ncbi:hypothetical protein DE146DRAFT_651556 [Phaeosphaeria sp. MPI-PUGE-AT-0046c]|nr:hypothetical protein DE146DRAFT_651556 [Phaeosphaeria sp. MPI-PUGE-AT-0046c]
MCITWKTEIFGLWETLWSDSCIIFLFPMFFASNWFYTYQFNDVPVQRRQSRAIQHSQKSAEQHALLGGADDWVVDVWIRLGFPERETHDEGKGRVGGHVCAHVCRLGRGISVSETV